MPGGEAPPQKLISAKVFPQRKRYKLAARGLSMKLKIKSRKSCTAELRDEAIIGTYNMY